MESVVSKVVKEEIAAAVAQQYTDEGSSKEKSVKTNGASQGTKWSSNAATRLNGLLTKITQKGDKRDKLNFQVLYVLLTIKKQCVSQKYGWGYRSIGFNDNYDDITFKSLFN